MDAVEPFFQKDHIREILKEFVRRLKGVPKGESLSSQVVGYLSSVVFIIEANAKSFDELCQFNIKLIGLRFVESLERFDPEKDSEIVELPGIFVSAVRFVCELGLVMPEDLARNLGLALRFADENIGKFSEHLKSELVYARYLMPADVLKRFLHHQDIGELKKFNETFSKAETLRAEWSAAIDERAKKVDELQARLAAYTSEYNFVGLVSAFKHLLGEKVKESRFAFGSLVLIGVLAIVFPLAELVAVAGGWLPVDLKSERLLFAIPAAIALEVIIIYFFRVVLSHFRSIKAQILQLQLRSALCQFIQSYADYSSDIKKKDASSLDRFEQLIFSGLITNDDKLPTTFDGLEQVVKLVQSVRPK